MATRKMREVQKIEIPAKLTAGDYFLELDINPNAESSDKEIIGRLIKDNNSKVYFKGAIPTLVNSSDNTITLTLTLNKVTE